MTELLTVPEVAVILRVTDHTVRSWIKQGTLKAVVLPHSTDRQGYRVKLETVNAIVAKK